MKSATYTVERLSSARTTVKTSISLQPELLRQAKMAAELAGYRFSFSGYVADALRDKIECQRQKKLQSV